MDHNTQLILISYGRCKFFCFLMIYKKSIFLCVIFFVLVRLKFLSGMERFTCCTWQGSAFNSKYKILVWASKAWLTKRICCSIGNKIHAEMRRRQRCYSRIFCVHCFCFCLLHFPFKSLHKIFSPQQFLGIVCDSSRWRV